MSNTELTESPPQTASKGCHAFRDRLERCVLAELNKERSTAASTSGDDHLDPLKTTIQVNVAPFDSVAQADAAEMLIDWFAPDQANRRRACRVAFAAQELQRYLQRITGQEQGFEIVSKPAPNGSSIILEMDDDVAETDGQFEITQHHEGYMFRALSIQGCLYAVYEYLQQLGCAFLGPDDEVISKLKTLPPPKSTHQSPSFTWRRLHGWRKNRATPQLIDWMGKARINTWGADNLVPGMRKRGILLTSGMHDVLPVAGLSDDFNVLDEAQCDQLVQSMIDAFANGPWQEADICEYIGADFGRRPEVQFEGNNADLELLAIHELRQGLHQAYTDGKINRDLFVSGYAYFDCEEPPILSMPDGFDHDHIAVEFWSMRCYEHFLDEPDCHEDFPIISSMNHFLGQQLAMPSNIKIHQRLSGWLKQSAFNGRMGLGYYASNAANYYMPLGLMATFCHELPMLHRMGVRQINYMHISTDDWGPKAVTNLLYSRLAWDANADPALLLANYFHNRYNRHAPAMAKAYFDLERGVCGTPLLKRFAINRLKTTGSLRDIAEHRHVHILSSGDSNKAVPSVGETSRLAQRALESVNKVCSSSQIKKDLPWFEYAAWTAELFELVFKAQVLHEASDHAQARSHMVQVSDVIARLKGLDLDLCLPENIRVDAAEASVLMSIIKTLAQKLNVSIQGVHNSPSLQTGIMPLSKLDVSKPQTNPTLQSPDTNWPAPSPVDEIGIQYATLIETGIKHQGLVAQTIDGQVLLVSVGNDSAQGKPNKQGSLDCSSAICFTGTGERVWQHDFQRKNHSVHIGPWPAFIDLTGQGDWAVSVFVIYDGGDGKREGWIYLFDARSGNLRWKIATQPHDNYPGGNGSCAAADIDGDGRIEIVYGLCNQVLCVDALTGATKWIYNDKIKICHGRFAMTDINDDGLPEIIVATEYADQPDNPNSSRSSILSLDGKGKLLRRLSNIQGDLGSTPIIAVDVDGDGKPEIIHGSENLVYHEPRHMGELLILERWLTPKLDPIATGGARFAAGDIDGDGYPEAVGVPSYRDGGPLVTPHIFSVRLLDGRVKWKAPIARVWLDGDPIMADIDNDGQLETIVTTNYPSGYMHQPGTQPWSDLYIIKGNGQIIYQQTFDDAAQSPIAVDIDNDGLVEIVVPCYDGKVHVLRTPGPAKLTNWPLICHDPCRTGVYQP